MTVKELMFQLSKLDPNAEVLRHDDEHFILESTDLTLGEMTLIGQSVVFWPDHCKLDNPNTNRNPAIRLG